MGRWLLGLILLGWTTQAFAQYIDPEMTGKALTRHYIETCTYYRDWELGGSIGWRGFSLSLSLRIPRAYEGWRNVTVKECWTEGNECLFGDVSVIISPCFP
ncbi:MAG: hypothetical protein Q9M35_04900 [Rhodothermus sp.]|nr:hypothetical protein [Rhodothermus sp.]